MFCAQARKLSDSRLQAILFVRKWHVLGRFAAEFFDDTRGVQQGDERINALFEAKTCEQVLQSVDKSNAFVNVGCILAAGISLMGVIIALANAFDVGEPESNVVAGTPAKQD